MLKTLSGLVFLAALGYLGLVLVIYLKQRAMLYFPTPPVSSTEAQAIWLDHEGERLKIWHAAGTSERALIYFGGNAEDVSLNIEQLKRLLPEYHLYLHNYRGYGGSTGSPDERALFGDSLALYELVAKRHEKIALMGRSLGSGVALYLASLKPVTGVVLVTPYARMVEVAAHYYPYLPVKTLMKDRFDSVSRAGDVEVPVLSLVAELDEVIPRSMSEELSRAFRPGQVRETVIDRAFHNTISSSPEYERLLHKFLDGL